MKGLLALLISSMVLPAHAGIVIYGTRIIYPAEHKEVMVQLMNQGNRSSLMQAWIDDGDTSLPPEKIQVPFMLTPPVAKIGANSGQQVKIKIMPNKLPTNKESIFYLNVLDIPPNSPEQEGKNLAMIKNLTVVGFNDFTVGVADQHVRATHIGPVRPGIRRGQVT